MPIKVFNKNYHSSSLRFLHFIYDAIKFHDINQWPTTLSRVRINTLTDLKGRSFKKSGNIVTLKCRVIPKLQFIFSLASL